MCQPASYVIDNSLQLLVPQHRHRVSTLVLFVGLEVYLMKKFAAVQLVHGGIGVLVVTAWKLPAGPALIVAFWVRLDNADVDVVLQTLEVSHEIRSVCERTEKTNVKVVSPFLWLERPIFADVAMPTVLGARMDTFGNLYCRHVTCFWDEGTDSTWSRSKCLRDLV